MDVSKLGKDIRLKLGLKYAPVGVYFMDKKPRDAIGFRKKGSGCIIPLILLSAKGKIVAFDENSTGWPCSAFHLGYRDSIFPGITYFLSHGPILRECERFVKTPEIARQYIDAMRATEKTSGATVFKPLEDFESGERPEVVIFFADPDRLSALVYLTYFSKSPNTDHLMARFTSACGSIITLPLMNSRRGEHKAIWGLHDISARARIPRDLMSYAMPFAMLEELWKDAPESFLTTNQWEMILKRHQRI